MHKHGEALEGGTIEAVDPRGECKDGIPAERIIGCVVYPATELIAPGLELGRLTGVATPTITAIYQASKLLAHVIETEKVAVRNIELPQV